MIDAASVAGLNVLSLINDVTACMLRRERVMVEEEGERYVGIDVCTVAMIYARDRFDNETQNVIFYDSGATSTSALLATFQAIPDIKSTKNKTIGNFLIE